MVLSLVLLITIFNLNMVDGGNKTIRVTLPKFDVTLNGIKVNTQFSKYPLIVYNNITYFPMTYYDSRFLGIETKWSKENGLSIVSTGVYSDYNPYTTTIKNNSSYNAIIKDYKVKINNTIIDNTKENYPLISFRDVTYFPLTWRFAVDEFNWDYKFDSKTGLSITTKNVRANKLKLYNPAQYTSVSVMDDYIYYLGKGEKDTYNAYKLKMSLDEEPIKLGVINSIDSGFSGFYKEYGNIYFRIHYGGAVMGSDHYYKIKEDNSMEEITSGYLDFIEHNNSLIVKSDFLPPSPNNLYTITNEKKAELGTKTTLYMGNMLLKNNYIYITGIPEYDDITSDFSNTYLYKININTNEEDLLSSFKVSDFIIDGNNIYMKNLENNRLYKKEIASDKTVPIIDKAINKFTINKGVIYYTDNESKELYKIDTNGKSEVVLPNYSVGSFLITDSYITCNSYEDSKYGMIVLNKNGEVIFKTVQLINSFSIDDNMLVYTERSEKAYQFSPYYVRLP